MDGIRWLSYINAQGITIERPFLIVGTMRSGTTLLNRMLNTHPGLRVFYTETEFFRTYYNKYTPLDERNFARFIDDFKVRMSQFDINIDMNVIEAIKVSFHNMALATEKSLY